MIRSFVKWADQPRQNGIVAAIEQVLAHAPLSILDMGCGHGQLAKRLKQNNGKRQITGVDVVVQPDCAIPVSVYDGTTIPFADDSFDAVLCIDMLHHTDNPTAILQEARRVARKWVIVKDHIADSKWDHRTLTVLDWMGNAGTGVPLPYNFLSSAQWQSAFDRAGLVEKAKVHPLRYWPGVIGHLFDRQYHFVSKLEKYAQT